MDVTKDFWFYYYNSNTIVGSDDLQKNVGRTKNGNPITPTEWNTILDYIQSQIKLDVNDNIIEVCCGNGLVIGELSKKCNEAVGIDYSDLLIEQLNNNYPNVKTILSDVMEYQLDINTYNKAILYFAAQHFTERQLLKLIKNIISSLKENGILLIGDIPDDTKKWNYISEPVHKKDYFQRLENGVPKIGNWFNRNWFESLSFFIDGINVEIMEQPDYMINSNYRFDVLITKTK